MGWEGVAACASASDPLTVADLTALTGPLGAGAGALALATGDFLRADFAFEAGSAPGSTIPKDSCSRAGS